MKIRVNTYAGYKANERPQAIVMGGKSLKVEEILDRWTGEDHDYFKLKADDGALYIIRYDRESDEWELTLMDSRPL